MGCLCVYHPEIEDFITAKSWDKDRLTQFNMSVLVDDDFMIAVKNNEDIYLHYPCMTEKGEIENNTDKWIIKKKVNARELWDKIMQQAYNQGEPGILFYDNMNKDNNLKYIENIVTTNPCFTGDMRLLTDKGYKTFEELCDTDFNIISYDGNISQGKVWCNGEKDTIKLCMSNGTEITCTPDHRFMTIDGDECEAKNLKDKKIMPKIYKTIKEDKLYIKLGFIQGDGQLTRLNSKYHNGLEVNIGDKDSDIIYLFENDKHTENYKKIYLQDYNDLFTTLGFSQEILPNRSLPSTYNSWTFEQKANFLQGCFSANGCVNSNIRISYKTTCKEFASQLINTLEKDFGITANLTINKKHKVKFNNGEYECRESYDVNINKYNDILIFAQYIGFYQNYKKIKLIKLIEIKVPYVRNIKNNGKHLVYDFNEPINHWGIVEGYVAHNCSEYIAGILDTNDGKEYMGACNLGSLFLHNYVVNPFEKDAHFDFNKLREVIPVAVRMLDNIIDINYYPLEAFENYQKNVRTIGIGITGLHDMLCMLGYKYSEEKAIEFVDNLMDFIVYNVYMSSIELAKEKGSFEFLNREKFIESNFINKHISKNIDWENVKKGILEYGIRNGRMISIAPVGTLSLTFGENCSSGLEPIFDLEYERTIRVGGQDEENEVVRKVRDYAYDVWKSKLIPYVSEDVFETALNLSVNDHLKMLKTIAYHVDMNCSKTINVPTETSFEDVKEIYYDCWENGIKGCTIFRPNPIRQGIFNRKDNEETITQNNKWLPIPKDTVYFRKKIHTGCGKLVLFVGYSKSEDRLTDFYIKRSANGGCVHNIDAVVICMSGMLRLGGNLDNIEKAFSGCGTCNSFTTARLKGKKLSNGKSCPTAILNAIKEVQNEIKSNTINIIGNTEEISDKCPECGEKIQYSGGCVICPNCGFSKC